VLCKSGAKVRKKVKSEERSVKNYVFLGVRDKLQLTGRVRLTMYKMKGNQEKRCLFANFCPFFLFIRLKVVPLRAQNETLR
jgi:hypothetical protein